MSGDTVAVWGCGPVAQMAIQNAWPLGTGRVIAIVRIREHLTMVQTVGWGEMLDGTKEDVHERLIALTNGRGQVRCIDAVRAEAHAGDGVDTVPDKAKAATVRTVDRAAGPQIPPCPFVG